MGTKELQIMRFGSANNILTRVRHILDYDFSNLDYLELVFEITFSQCEPDTETSMLDLSYWYQDLHDALVYFESKGASEVKDLNKLAKLVSSKLDEVHLALVAAKPEEWPEYQYLLENQGNKTTKKRVRQPKTSASALYSQIAKLLKRNSELSIKDFWPQVERHNGKTVELLNVEFELIKEQSLRMKAVREQLLCGCIEVTNLVTDYEYRKSKADFSLVSEDCGKEEAATLTYGAVEKRLNRMKNALKANKES